ncbi:MAG: NrfD/PsrC family molybdoenzyme membrane anchor subunit [Dehalococcoidia bacterium]|nr:NrfD/PsrC family molybdoenzyme membrane anchor subunit [Dehalococcoidia bacterium]MDZ4247059.1 NrfD/PsrC family molybdoenzyme membrane anchor subunit [Dehalococcoidia bacterium]
MPKIKYAKYMVDFTPQTEWSEGTGWFLITAFFTGGIAGGLYLLSLQQHFWLGAVIAYGIVLLIKFPAHLLFLGHPFRFWRLVWRPQSSWLSRTMISELMFSVFPFLQLLAWTVEKYPALNTWLGWLPWSGFNPVIVGIAAFSAFVMIIGTGFIIAGGMGIQAWNTTLVPFLMLSYSFLGGTGLILLMSPWLSSADVNMATIELIARWLLGVTALLVIIYLWTVYYAGPAAKRSVIDLFKGRAAMTFVPGVIVLGLIIPIAVISWGTVGQLSPGIVFFAAVCELIGGFTMRYSLIKAGVFAPLV